MTAPPQVFPNRRAAWKYLQEKNYPVSQSKFYEDAARLGMVRPDKSVYLGDLIAYCDSELRPSPARDLAGEDLRRRREVAETRKASADADKAQMQADAMRRELDATWMLRADAEAETCVWVSRMRDAFAYHMGKAAPALIHAGGGNPARLAEVQSILDAALAAACNEIADSPEITVEIGELDD